MLLQDDRSDERCAAAKLFCIVSVLQVQFTALLLLGMAELHVGVITDQT